MKEERPNILLIMSDEHDAAVTGCYGDAVVDTPHLDALAQRGVTFDSCYTPSPLCSPARLAFTSCQYVSRNSAWSNNSWLPSNDYPSIAHALNRVGYESILAGKMHYDVTRDYGFEIPFRRGSGKPKMGLTKRRKPDSQAIDLRLWEERHKDFHAGEHSHVLDGDKRVTKYCQDFLAERKQDDKPFFLIAGYLAPHFPLIVPEAYHQKYKDRVPMPDIPEGALETLPTNYQHLRKGFGVTETDDAIVKKGRELYWGLIDWFDGQVGELLKSLEDSEVADNTIVIYTSDHGENKGDHGMWWKSCMYEHSARIPLIVSWPKRWAGGQRRTEACNLLDVVQTIADIAGAETEDNWDGDSMVPWLDDAQHAWKDFALSEYYAQLIASGYTMVRRGDYKYVYHVPMSEAHESELELYHLKDDPKEWNNLAYESEYAEVVKALHQAMLDELGEHPDDIELRACEELTVGYQREV